MKFWKEKCGDCIYNLDYELLTTNQEIETKIEAAKKEIMDCINLPLMLFLTYCILI